MPLSRRQAIAVAATVGVGLTAGTVVGGDVGALVILTGARRHGQEIEVSQVGGQVPVRTHAAVRAREVAPTTMYGAVIPALPAGRYVIWADPDTPLAVEVARGMVTEYWREEPSP